MFIEQGKVRNAMVGLLLRVFAEVGEDAVIKGIKHVMACLLHEARNIVRYRGPRLRVWSGGDEITNTPPNPPHPLVMAVGPVVRDRANVLYVPALALETVELKTNIRFRIL